MNRTYMFPIKLTGEWGSPSEDQIVSVTNPHHNTILPIQGRCANSKQRYPRWGWRARRPYFKLISPHTPVSYTDANIILVSCVRLDPGVQVTSPIMVVMSTCPRYHHLLKLPLSNSTSSGRWVLKLL